MSEISLNYPVGNDNHILAKINENSLTIQNAINSIENRSTNCILEMPTKPTYSDLTVTVYAGTKVVIPNGRNADGTMRNIIYTPAANLVKSPVANTNMTDYIFIYSTGGISDIPATNMLHINRLSELPTTVPTTGYYKCYVEETNLWYATNGSNTTNWSSNGQTFAIVATAVVGASAITSLTPYNVLKYVDTNMINELTTVNLTSTDLGTISAHTVSKKNGVVLYRLSGQCGTWTANSNYVVTTIPIGYRPFATYDKELRLNDVFFGHLTIGTNGNVYIVPRATISASTIAINETFLT